MSGMLLKIWRKDWRRRNT